MSLKTSRIDNGTVVLFSNTTMVRPTPEKPVKKALPFIGIIYTLISTMIFTGSMFVIKELEVDMLEALIPYYVAHSAITLIYMKVIKKYSLYTNISRRALLLLIVNAVTSSTGFFCFYFAYRYLLLPDVTTIRYTQVIWTAILTAILYRECPSIFMIAGIILTAVGIVLVAQPSFIFGRASNSKNTNTIPKQNFEHLIGLGLALYASIATTIMIVTNKVLLVKHKIKSSLIILHFAILALLLVIGYVLYKYHLFIGGTRKFAKNYFNWRYLVASLTTLLYVPALTLAQKAIKIEHPSIFTIIQSSGILLAMVLQNIFSSNKSNLLSIIGSILVLMSICIITGSKFYYDRKEQKRKMKIYAIG